MTKLDFPDTPSTGQQYGSAGTIWRWDGTRWGSTAGAAGARGQVAFARITANQSGISSTIVAIAGLSVSWTANPSRMYRTTAVAEIGSNAASDLPVMNISDGLGNVKARATNVLAPNASGWGETHTATAIETGLSGTQTRAVGVVRASGGTGFLTVLANPAYPAFILVEDITYEAGAVGAGGSVPPAPRFTTTDAHLASSALFTATPYTVTPLNIPITPLSANSKFLMRAVLQMGHLGCDDTIFFLFRNGVGIGSGAIGSQANGNKYHRFTAANNLETATIVLEWLDSPNTAALVNYIPGFGVRTTGQTLYLNRRGADATMGGRSSFTVQEIP